MITKNSLIILIVFLNFWQLQEATSQINWVTIEQAEQMAKTTDKKIIVDVYTDWCGWCKKMDRTTFADEQIISFINDNYIAVKLNAETKRTINLEGKTYKYIDDNARGNNEYAVKLLRGNLQFPTLVFLDNNMNLIQPIPGFLEVNKLQMILTYYNYDYHKRMTWDAFARQYKAEEKAAIENKSGVKSVLTNGTR